MRHQKKLLAIGFIALGINLLWAGAVLGQSYQSTVSINRTGSLSFDTIPTNFDFGAMMVPVLRTATFSDPTVTAGSLPAGKKLTVQDTRGQGGFMVTISANGNFIETSGGPGIIAVSNTSPNDNLRIVTSPLFVGATGVTTNGMVYEPGFGGPQTVSAEIGTASDNFADPNTFLNVSNNILDTAVPVDVLNGTLPGTDGRIGLVSTGVSAMLYIPAFQATGQYVTTLTWTLSDSTL